MCCSHPHLSHFTGENIDTHRNECFAVSKPFPVTHILHSWRLKEKMRGKKEEAWTKVSVRLHYGYRRRTRAVLALRIGNDCEPCSLPQETRQSSEWRRQQGHKLPGAHAVLTLFWCTAWHRTHLPCVHLPLGCSCDLGRFREDWFWIPGDCQPPDVLKQPSEVYKVLWFPSSPSILLFSPLFKSFLPHSLVYLRCKKVNIPLVLRVLQSSGPSQCCQRLDHALSSNFSHVSFVSYVISPSLGMKHLHQWKFNLLQVISGNKLT